MSILSVSNLNIDYIVNDNIAHSVSDINFKLKEGEVLGIIGESGCGKSTIAKAILNILPKNAKVCGEVNLNDKDILTMSKKDLQNIRGNEISMVFQDPMLSLNPMRKIKKQFYDILHDYKKANGKLKTDELIKKQLEEVNLTDTEKILKSYPFELSGGMAQRVIIAMSLIKSPKILIADEPTAAIDAINRKEILNEIKNLKHMSIIVISHNLNEVYDMCDNLLVMYKGKVVEYGNVKEVFENPQHEYTKTLLQIRNMEDEEYDNQLFA